LGKDAQYWIDKLHLEEHPEGGYFVETYRSEKFINLPDYCGPRNTYSAIYYLLEGDQFSAFHKLKSDELLHFYDGSSMILHIIETDGRLNEVRLGPDIDNRETFQTVVKSGSWFAASIDKRSSYSLVGCTVSPGFDYNDWKLGDMEALAKTYPKHKSIIEKYTRPRT
jgi:predicted cupin superfamily sugar epimerase